MMLGTTDVTPDVGTDSSCEARATPSVTLSKLIVHQVVKGRMPGVCPMRAERWGDGHKVQVRRDVCPAAWLSERVDEKDE